MEISKLMNDLGAAVSELSAQKRLADQLVKVGEQVLGLCQKHGIEDIAITMFRDYLAKCHYNGIGND